MFTDRFTSPQRIGNARDLIETPQGSRTLSAHCHLFETRLFHYNTICEEQDRILARVATDYFMISLNQSCRNMVKNSNISFGTVKDIRDLMKEVQVLEKRQTHFERWDRMSEQSFKTRMPRSSPGKGRVPTRRMISRKEGRKQTLFVVRFATGMGIRKWTAGRSSQIGARVDPLLLNELNFRL